MPQSLTDGHLVYSVLQQLPLQKCVFEHMCISVVFLLDTLLELESRVCSY